MVFDEWRCRFIRRRFSRIYQGATETQTAFQTSPTPALPSSILIKRIPTKMESTALVTRLTTTTARRTRKTIVRAVFAPPQTPPTSSTGQRQVCGSSLGVLSSPSPGTAGAKRRGSQDPERRRRRRPRPGRRSRWPIVGRTSRRLVLTHNRDDEAVPPVPESSNTSEASAPIPSSTRSGGPLRSPESLHASSLRRRFPQQVLESLRPCARSFSTTRPETTGFGPIALAERRGFPTIARSTPKVR
jgi:hypothetical protein